MTNLSQHRIKELMDYNPETGLFILKLYRGGRVKKGDVLGNKNQSGYIHIKADGKEYKAHRLAFLWMIGEFPKEVDHINRIKDDNRWINLRSADRSINCRNRNFNKKRELPLNIYRHLDKFKVCVSYENKNNYLGVFSTLEEALNARDMFLEKINN